MDVMEEHHLWSRDEVRRAVRVDRPRQAWRGLAGVAVLAVLAVIAVMITQGYVLGY